MKLDFDYQAAFLILSENYNLSDKTPELLQLILIREFEQYDSISKIKKEYEIFKQKR